jgi:hypothetical protein
VSVNSRPSPATTAGVAPVRPGVVVSGTVIRLLWTTAALAALAAAVGVFWQGGAAPETVTSVRGDTVSLHGRGLYRFDSAYRGPANQGTDVVALTLFVPLLIASTLRCQKGSVRGVLLVAASLLWLLYLHLSLAVSAAYNELFLVYVTLVATTATGLVLLVRSLDLQRLTERLDDRFPRRAISRFFIAVCAVTGLLWGGLALSALASGSAPAHLEHATTTVEEALSLGLLVPAFLLAAVALRRGEDALGATLGVPLLVLVAGLAPVVTAQTIAQQLAGVPLTAQEVAGLVASWIVLGALALALAIRALRSIREVPVPEPSDRAP